MCNRAVWFEETLIGGHIISNDDSLFIFRLLLSLFLDLLLPLTRRLLYRLQLHLPLLSHAGNIRVHTFN